MEIVDKLQDLWDGIILKYDFDLANHEISFNIHLMDGGYTARYLLRMSRVTTFRFDDESVRRRKDDWDPWVFCELTEIYAEKIEADGREWWKVTADIWGAEFEVVCMDLSLTPVIEVGSRQ
jgi:hypothetical protein